MKDDIEVGSKDLASRDLAKEKVGKEMKAEVDESMQMLDSENVNDDTNNVKDELENSKWMDGEEI